MDIFSFLIIVWVVKILAEDAWTTVKGQPNPRVERRAARVKHRSRNRVWGAFTNYLGDVAEDAREHAAEKRRERRELQRLERERAAAIEDPAELPPRPSGGDSPVDIDLDDPKEDIDHAPGSGEVEPGPTPNNVIPMFRTISAPTANTAEENDPVSTDINSEVTGLDPAIAYAEALVSWAAEHAQAGNEGYIGVLEQADVKGEAISTAHEMQEAFAAAAAAAERHKGELVKQKTVQEAYNNNPDAGDKEFQLNGQ